MCIVAPSLRLFGGQSIQADRLRRFLERDGVARTSFVPHNPQLPAPFDRLQRIKLVRTVVTTAAYAGLLLARLRRCDVVHVFSASYWSYLLGPMLAVFVGRLYGKPVVLNYRSGELEDHLQTWPQFITRTMALAHIVTPVPYLAEVFARYGFRTAGVVPNYLDLSQRAYRPRGVLRPVFLVNRLFEPLYDYPCALDAFALVQRQVPEARLIIAGHGPLREQILRWIEERGLRNVDFRGKVRPEEMARLYDEADVYLNATRLDCFPSSILDAYASGAVVVTTNAGGIRDIVDHGRTGWMVECGDAAGLAEGALRLLGDPALAERFATAGRREVETRYTWDAVRPQWAAMYARLTGGVTPPSRSGPA